MREKRYSGRNPYGYGGGNRYPDHYSDQHGSRWPQDRGAPHHSDYYEPGRYARAHEQWEQSGQQGHHRGNRSWQHENEPRDFFHRAGRKIKQAWQRFTDDEYDYPRNRGWQNTGSEPREYSSYNEGYSGRNAADYNDHYSDRRYYDPRDYDRAGYRSNPDADRHNDYAAQYPGSRQSHARRNYDNDYDYYESYPSYNHSQRYGNDFEDTMDSYIDKQESRYPRGYDNEDTTRASERRHRYGNNAYIY